MSLIDDPAPAGADPQEDRAQALADADAARRAKRRGREWRLTVQSAFNINPRMRRVRFSAEELAEFEYKPGQEMVLEIPYMDTLVRRHYTIRRCDPAAGILDIDFVLHGNGLAAHWAQTTTPHERIVAYGPRGRTFANPNAQWHLFSGDETCIPAIAGMLESLPAHTKAFAFIEAGSADDEQAINTKAELTLEWIHREGRAPGPNGLLIDRLAAFQGPHTQGHAYIIGETSTVRAQRHGLLARGWTREQISAEGYWRPGRVGGHDHVGRDEEMAPTL